MFIYQRFKKKSVKSLYLPLLCQTKLCLENIMVKLCFETIYFSTTCGVEVKSQNFILKAFKMAKTKFEEVKTEDNSIKKIFRIKKKPSAKKVIFLFNISSDSILDELR